MSVFCPSCGMKTFNEYQCDYCSHSIKEADIYGKSMESQKIYYSKKSIGLNVVLLIAILVIAVSMGYLAYTKYEERKLTEEAMKYMTGVSDPKEYMNMSLEEKMKKQKDAKMMKEVDKMIDIQVKEINKMTSQILNSKK